jgi:hypothetical protein
MRTLAITALLMLWASVAAAQTIATEVDMSAGYSTEDVSAAATQIRVFGQVFGGVRFFGEAAWGARYFPVARPESATDVFGAAYPYENRAQLIEAYGERIFKPGAGLVGLRAGRFRTPFGIYNQSDHAYSGFLRAPMIRYDDYYALSNSYVEHGADLIVGAPQAYIEASLGAPADVSETRRRSGLDTVIRGQGYYRSVIAGVSFYRAMPYQPASFAKGHAVFTGVDVRWMQSGVQVRGEFITGQPFNGTTTTGGYVDLLVHRVAMGPVTAVARLERLDYDTPSPFFLFARRAMAGARIRIAGGFTAQIAGGHQWGQQIQRDRTALDLALTYSLRRDVETHRP